MISFAGINLPDQSGPVLERLHLLSPEDLFDFTRVTYPGSAIASLGWPSQARARVPRVGSLWWPSGASRWAVGLFLVTDKELTPIRQAVYATPGTPTPQLFTINDGKRSLTTSLYMLPPRPLTQITGNNNAWLMPLVDARYWWQKQVGDIAVTEGTTTWLGLYSQIATALGITLTVGSIPSAYLSPTADFNVGYESLPLLLDAVARSLGQRIVRDFAGNVRAWNVANSQTQVATNFSVNALLAGGEMEVTASNSTDLPSAVPQSVTVLFPNQGTNGSIPNDQTIYTVTLASLALPEFFGVTGVTGSALLRSVQVAEWTDNTHLVNNAALQALANQMATDWYRYATSPMDAAYHGVLNWTPEGLTDSLEFFHKNEDIWTRVQRQPWNDCVLFEEPVAPEIFPARLTSVSAGTGAFAGKWLYGFIEQQENTASGNYQDFTDGRQATPRTSWAYEINNADLTVTGSGPLVWMRRRGFLLANPPTGLGLSLAAGGSLTSGQTYTYAVTAVTAIGESLPSNEPSITTTPGNLTVNLSWSSTPTADSYNVYRLPNGGSWVLVGNTTSTTFADTGAAGGAGSPPTTAPKALPLYEFYSGNATGGTTTQWINVTSLSSSTITIGSGGTVKAYPAVLTNWSSITGTWTDTTTVVWFYPTNGNVPVIGNRYQCISFGTASDTKAVWGEDTQEEDQWVVINSATPSTITVGSNAGITAYDCFISAFQQSTGTWTNGATHHWFMPSNGEVPTASNRYKCVSVAVDSGGKQVWSNSQYLSTYFSGARFSNSSLQAISSGVPTTLSLSGATQDYDTDSYTATLTVPVTGYYRGFFQVLCPATGSVPYSVELAVTHSGGTIDASIPSSGAHIQVVYEFHLGSGATVQCTLTHNAGSTLNFKTEIATVTLELIPGVSINPTTHTITPVI